MAAPDTACTTIEPLLAAYALGERDAATQAAIDAHLATCPACRVTLAAHQATGRLIGLGAADATPRPELRAQVIEAVAAAAQGVQTPSPRPNRRPFARWAAALAALAVVVLLAWNIVLQRELASAHVAAQQQATLVALLQNPDLERYSMTFDKPLPHAQAHLAIAPDQSVAALTASGLPVLPADRVYQLWLVRDGVRANGGTFAVDATGSGVLLVQAPLPLSSYQVAGVTVEPRGGSSGPTSPRVMGCKLT